MISVLILTKNEQQDLPACLESVSWSNDIHVYDSMSDDATVDIAAAAGATVTKRAFDNWSSHQNWGLQNIEFKHPWVFYIDADERMTPALVESVRNAAKSAGDMAAFRVQRRDFFMGRWLKHVQTSPYYLRLFRPERMRYERLVNPVSIVDGPVGQIDGYSITFPLAKASVIGSIGTTVTARSKHNRYWITERRTRSFILVERSSKRTFTPAATTRRNSSTGCQHGR